MNSLLDILHILKNELPHLRTKYHVDTLKIFGSLARNQHSSSSDIDILIRFTKTPSLFTLIRLESYLFDKTGAKIDLILEDNIKPAFKESISKDIISIN